MYSIDTSTLIDWQDRHYPLDVFPSLGSRFEDLVREGHCAAVDLVLEEVEAVASPGLRAWAKNHKGLFVPLAPEIQTEAAGIEARYPDLMDPKIPYQ
jgi:hypothetical protein